MDLYRYFHPHFNPRLRHQPLRLIELGELAQAAAEIKNALSRAHLRSSNAPNSLGEESQFMELTGLLDIVIQRLQTIAESMPEDDLQTMKRLLEERKNAPGWEGWCALLAERLQLLEQQEHLQSLRTSEARRMAGGSR